jgi:hypothetical protein
MKPRGRPGSGEPRCPSLLPAGMAARPGDVLAVPAACRRVPRVMRRWRGPPRRRGCWRPAGRGEPVAAGLVGGHLGDAEDDELVQGVGDRAGGPGQYLADLVRGEAGAGNVRSCSATRSRSPPGRVAGGCRPLAAAVSTRRPVRPAPGRCPGQPRQSAGPRLRGPSRRRPGRPRRGRPGPGQGQGRLRRRAPRCRGMPGRPPFTRVAVPAFSCATPPAITAPPPARRPAAALR